MKISSVLKDIVSTLITVVVIVLVGIAVTGTWPFVVAIESGSMEPHMYRGDVVILFSPDRVGIVTWEKGKEIGYTSFGDFGDVIVYKPNGHGKPIIHRVIAYVHKGEKIPILNNGRLILSNIRAPADGYITQGDANSVPDQLAMMNGERILPVKKEWIIGVAKFRIPLVGYVRLIFNFF